MLLSYQIITCLKFEPQTSNVITMFVDIPKWRSMQAKRGFTKCVALHYLVEPHWHRGPISPYSQQRRSPPGSALYFDSILITLRAQLIIISCPRDSQNRARLSPGRLEMKPGPPKQVVFKALNLQMVHQGVELQLTNASAAMERTHISPRNAQRGRRKVKSDQADRSNSPPTGTKSIR